MDFPSRAKERIIVGTDFSFELKDAACAAGTINVAKVLGFRFDIIEIGTRKDPKVRFGRVKNKGSLGKLTCNFEQHEFANIKKLAQGQDKDGNKVILLMTQTADANPSTFGRQFCANDPRNFNYEFEDFESGATKTIPAASVLDYIPSRFN